MTNNPTNKINTETSTDIDVTEKMFFERMVKELKEGELIKGKVIGITKDVVVVDMEYKSEGQIPLKEFLDPKGNLTINVGDEIEAILENSDDDRGYVILSAAKAKQRRMWKEVEEAYNTGKTLEGRILQKIKGGFSVDLNGITAFLPGSQVDTRPVTNPDKFINNLFTFKVLQYDRRKPNIVVSRRAVLEEEREQIKKNTIQALEEGKIVDGIVKNITNYGVFVDLGGIDGLLHVSDISWGKIKNPSDIFKVGDTISVKILKFNKAENKISLGLKQMRPNPWDKAEERYPVGSKVKGKVVKIVDYGAFMELEEGMEGLVHLSELCWTKIKDASQKLKLEDTVEVKVLEIDSANKKISLSLKQLEPNLWDAIEMKYPKGARIKGTVKNITDFGIFIEVEDGIDGLVHISDMSWKKIKHPTELFQKGQEIEAEVLSIDKDKQRFALSTKGLQKNPWQGIEERYHAGMSISGKVTNIANFGVFVELEDGVDGLIHISELNRGKKKGLNIAIGDMVEAEVLNVDPQEKKIGLGLRGLAVVGEKTAT
ncbi:MAG: 30S ribosomal protein S1 [Deltaproteobacteria bacterium]|nr:30S ribosomal protein S1 [Deltaproteobacteria bacterium]